MRNDIPSGLDWNLPMETQRKTIETIATDSTFAVEQLLQPGDKALWENAAKTLLLIGPSRVENALPGLLAWFKDINWPGVNYVMELLAKFPVSVLRNATKIAKEKASMEKDDEWYENIVLIENSSYVENMMRRNKQLEG